MIRKPADLMRLTVRPQGGSGDRDCGHSAPSKSANESTIFCPSMVPEYRLRGLEFEPCVGSRRRAVQWEIKMKEGGQMRERKDIVLGCEGEGAEAAWTVCAKVAEARPRVRLQNPNWFRERARHDPLPRHRPPSRPLPTFADPHSVSPHRCLHLSLLCFRMPGTRGHQQPNIPPVPSLGTRVCTGDRPLGQ